MQKPKRKPENTKRRTDRPGTGRVVDLRAWKQSHKGKPTYGAKRLNNSPFQVLVWVGIAFATLAVIFAILGCVPSSAEVSLILFGWLFAILGCGFGIWLYVMNHRWANRLLMICVSCMGLSFVASLVKVVVMTR